MSATPKPTAHEVRVVDGRFQHAECSCGWRGAGRRTRATARTEARDHALLYADGRGLGPSFTASDIPVPVVVERTVADV